MSKRLRGFTILELLVVLTVLGIFSIIAYPNISSWITDREVKKEVYETVTFINDMKTAVDSGKYLAKIKRLMLIRLKLLLFPYSKKLMRQLRG